MNLSVKPVFSFNLNHKTTPGIVTIGKYDGTHACLTAATSADKVSFVYLKMSFLFKMFYLTDNNSLPS